MTDRNENNELNEQELEQTAGGFSFSKAFRDPYIHYRCPKCNATKKVKDQGPASIFAPICDNCRGFVQMVKE